MSFIARRAGGFRLASTGGSRQGNLTSKMYARLEVAWKMCVAVYVRTMADEMKTHIATGMSLASLWPIAREVQFQTDKWGNTSVDLSDVFNFAHLPPSRWYRDISGDIVKGSKGVALGEDAGSSGWTIYTGTKGALTFEYESNVYQVLMHEGLIPPGYKDQAYFSWTPQANAHATMKEEVARILKTAIPSIMRSYVRGSFGFENDTPF